MIAEALLAEETRPRLVLSGSALLLVMRGVNLNPGADPDDMVSVRVWIDPHRILSLRARRVMAVSDINTALEEGCGPADPAEYLLMLSKRLIERLEPTIEDLSDEVDGLEQEVVHLAGEENRHRLASMRHTAITLRRHIAPQRDVMNRLLTESIDWINATHRSCLRETTDMLTRFVEDLDSMRERASVIQDEMMNRQAAQMNHRMFVLSIIAVVFLPLSFLTGLLGINVGGIPGSDHRAAFAIVCAFLAGIAVAQIALLRRMRWF
jgi:zinc transporter